MNAVNREHKQRWRGRHLVRNEFIFYERNSQLHRSVQYTNGYKNSARAKYVMAVFNRPRSMNQYSNKALRISGQTFIFGIFFVTKSPLGIEGWKDTLQSLGAMLEHWSIKRDIFVAGFSLPQPNSISEMSYNCFNFLHTVDYILLIAVSKNLTRAVSVEFLLESSRTFTFVRPISVNTLRTITTSDI